MTIEQVFSDVFTIRDSDINDELKFQDIPSWDSMGHMVLIMRLEQSFDVQLSGDQIANIASVGDARSALRTLGASV